MNNLVLMRFLCVQQKNVDLSVVVFGFNLHSEVTGVYPKVQPLFAVFFYPTGLCWNEHKFEN